MIKMIIKVIQKKQKNHKLKQIQKKRQTVNLKKKRMETKMK